MENLKLATDGTTSEAVPANGKTFTLKELQGFVGGLIEIVRLPGKQILIVNEEGIMRGLPINDQASALAQCPIFGNAAVVGSDTVE